MTKKNFLIPFLFLLGIVSNSYSQNHWKKANNQSIYQQRQEILPRDNFPTRYTLMNLDFSKFKNQLLQANTSRSSFSIELPNAKGNLERFNIIETPTLASGLSAKFPMIKTYTAYGVDNSYSTAKITIGTNGLHVIINTPEKSTVYIDPLSNSNEEYLVYRKIDFTHGDSDFTCEIEEQAREQADNHISHRNANDGKLRTYRLALTCTGEYSQFHLNRQGVAASATDAEKKAAVLSAMNTTIARVNEVYERDLAVRMVIVDNNEDLIFLDAATDGLSNSSASALINESQVKCDDIIGDANYDIGHAFSTGGGGLAQLRSVCVSGNKARGITGQGQPINDPFDIDYVAHEVGHQFGATHTQNNNCNRTNSTAVEPGSASTIMGYAGICAPNVQRNSDDHFHAVSIAQMWSHIQNTAGCPVETDTGNAAPTADAGSDYSIPKSTPFVLRGKATDANGTDNLTYNWEQTDTEVGTMPPVSTNTGGPMFRSLPSKTSPNRYMPDLTTVVAGNTASTWEVVPSVAREMNFALTVRDNHSGGGNSARDDVKVTTIDTDAFTVTSQNAMNQVIGIGNTELVTWNKGETDAAPINCQLINIRLSIDGGQTFPILLKENTPNDGSEEIVIPNSETTNARIMVEAADNLFYNINNVNFEIKQLTPSFELKNLTGDLSICNVATTEQSFEIKLDFLNGFNEEVTFNFSGTPSNTNPTLTENTLNNSGNTTLNLSNLNNATPGDYTITINANSPSINKTLDIHFNINDETCKSIGSTASSISTTLVSFADINNTSTKENGYSDYKTLNTEVIKGETYELKVNVNNDGHQVNSYAWIDWNQNCIFDDNEMYDLNINTSTGNINITVPSNALTGSTTLRVTTKNNSEGAPEACQLNFDGEVEDYTINLTPSYKLSNTNELISLCNNAITEHTFAFEYETFNDFSEDVTLATENLPAGAQVSFSENTINTNGTYNVTISNLDQVANGDYTISIKGNATIEQSTDIFLSINNNGCNARGNTDSEISITQVNFSSIENSSTKTTGYEDYSSIIAYVSRSDAYELTVNTNNDGATTNTYAFIDWNQDCVFDDNEIYPIVDSIISITIPETAALGETKLRIITKDDANGTPKECELNFNGEVEDYTVSVDESYATNQNLFSDLKIGQIPVERSNMSVTINFKVKDKDSTVISLFDLSGRLLKTEAYTIQSSRFIKDFTLGSASSGIYLLQIQNGGKHITKNIVIK